MRITRMALLGWMGGTAVMGSQPTSQLTWTLNVYVQRTTNVPCEVLIPAEGLATRMFAEIGIRLNWPTGKTVRESEQPPIFIELMQSNRANGGSGVLGQALPYEGRHITVFFDRLAAEERSALMLGHVMVHEITHLLQGISRHSETGVMKAQWTNWDRYEMRVKPLPFTANDVDLIYLGLTNRRVGTVTAAAKP